MAERPDRSPRVIWDRLSPGSRTRRGSLTYDRIVATAVEIADREGLDAVSMRRVASELGAGTMSLYRYVSTRDELVDLMVDQVIGELAEEPEPTSDWRSALADSARRSRALSRRHPWALPLVLGRPRIGPRALGETERSLAQVDGLGLDIDTMLDLISTVACFTVGFVQAELAEEEAVRRSGVSVAEWRAQVAPYIRRVLGTGEHPMLERVVQDAEDFPDNDLVFERRLGLVLDGIEARLGVGPPGEPAPDPGRLQP